MKIIPHRRPRGIALFIVLISIAVLTGMAMIFAAQMKVETKLASNSYNETDLEWLGRSGIEYARWVLSLELTTPGPGQRFDSLDQKWANGSGETNDTLASVSMTDIPLGQGKIRSIKIVDNERKFNINTLAFDQAMMNRILTQVGTDASEIPGIISSVQDWIDPDDEVREGGAESAFYQGLAHPYNAKNASIDDLTELLLIKGITTDIYWGPNATNHPPGYFQARNPANRGSMLPNTPIVAAGLADVFTPMSNGKLNILTASETELQFLPLVDASIASQIVKLRQETGENGFLPYSSPSDLLVNTSLGREGAPMAANYCTFRSSIFQVQVDVEIGMSHRTYYGLVQRNSPRDIPILGIYWK